MTEVILLVLVITFAIHELNKLLQNCLCANKETKETIRNMNKIVKRILKSL